MNNTNPNFDQRELSVGMLQRMSMWLQRTNFAAVLGQAFGGKRDYYSVFGYDRQITDQQMWEMYCRGGIAKRIVHAYPDAVWARPPYMDLGGSQDRFEETVKKHKLWSVIKTADVMAGLGRYSCVLVGTNRPNLAAPLRKGSGLEITFLQPYSERHVRIAEWETDPLSPRFGKPKFYTIYPDNHRMAYETPHASPPSLQSFRVHHSRIWHFQYGGLESDVFGIPRMVPIWNYLVDLTKIVGSSAESYWMTAYQGLHLNVDPEVEMAEEDAQELSDEADEYQHGLRRIIRTRGVDVKTLGSKVADPRGAFDVVMKLLSGSTGIPMRILLGSEAGQLASSQDQSNWADKIEEERANHAEPNILRPAMEWMSEYYDTPPIESLVPEWPEALRLTPLQRGQQSAQTARTAVQLQKAMEAREGEDPLLTREEARHIIGLSTDQAVIEDGDPALGTGLPLPTPEPAPLPTGVEDPTPDTTNQE